MNIDDKIDPAVEAKARELYEAARKRVSGRPPWEHLNPSDAYDMGMRGHALTEARKMLSTGVAE